MKGLIGASDNLTAGPSNKYYIEEVMLQLLDCTPTLAYGRGEICNNQEREEKTYYWDYWWHHKAYFGP